MHKNAVIINPGAAEVNDILKHSINLNPFVKRRVPFKMTQVTNTNNRNDINDDDRLTIN
jgi:hypothetical protein